MEHLSVLLAHPLTDAAQRVEHGLLVGRKDHCILGREVVFLLSVFGPSAPVKKKVSVRCQLVESHSNPQIALINRDFVPELEPPCRLQEPAGI